MCGVAGIFAYHYAALDVDAAELCAIRDHMQRRGPDGQGEWIAPDRRIGLAHRRLSIIDVSERAAQPMASADRRLVISFNGEIYNHRELRAALEARGHVFRTSSDTEVLLHLYADRGEEMLKDLRGMFAFALWDERKSACLLARDPYGIKPLYVADDGWTARFASQVKALLTSPKVSRAPEPAGLAGFYLFGSVPEPYTLYQEIRSVPAGSFQWIDATGPHAPREYFSVAQEWARPASRIEAGAVQQQFRDAALDSVKHHLVADVPVGIFLSAGIDSSALAGLMRDAGQRDIQAVTLAFDEFKGTDADEAPLAAQVAQAYGLRHTVRTVGKAEFDADLERILSCMDQPSIDGVNTWFVSKAAHEAGLKVAISGVGGDELLGGYPSFRSIPRWVRTLWLPSRIPGLGAVAERLCAAFQPLCAGLNPKAAGMLRLGGTYAGAWLLRRGLFMPHELPALMGRELAREGLGRLRPLRHIEQAACLSSGRGYARVAALEASLYMRNQLLRDTDWSSMAHSLEVRTPLVDAALLRAMAPALAASGEVHGKALLARSPRQPLPAPVTTRAKTGFGTPTGKWMKSVDGIRSGRAPWARGWSEVAIQSSQLTRGCAA